MVSNQGNGKLVAGQSFCHHKLVVLVAPRMLFVDWSRWLFGIQPAGGSLDLEADDYSPPGNSSSSSNPAVQRYLKKRGEVLEVAPTVFADAAEEFASLEAVKAKLEGWKAAYAQDYQNAYVPESAPALFAPFVRLQLLQWDPLYYKSSSSSADGGSSAAVAGKGDQVSKLFGILPFLVCSGFVMAGSRMLHYVLPLFC